MNTANFCHSTIILITCEIQCTRCYCSDCSQNSSQYINLFFFSLLTEHEGPVTAVGITADGLRILAGTTTGNLGMLDISTRNYTTLMRSHTSNVLSVSLDPTRRQLANVSLDHTIRIWHMDTLQQVRPSQGFINFILFI